MSDDLRDRIAEALYQWTVNLAAPGRTRPSYLDARTEEAMRANSLARASAVLAVVQPKLDRLAALDSAVGWDLTCTGCARAWDAAHAADTRAEQAQAELQRTRDTLVHLAARVLRERTYDDHDPTDEALRTIAVELKHLADPITRDDVVRTDPDQPAEEPEPAQHAKGANGEDCPACTGRRDLPYPFICPGAPDQPAEESP